ncbi:hypothetical protein HD554DRAFT_2176980 [Boletus coccyginus]|nr:hypothetical protein HD554DRAFT_2176980 [Boletus coccyginus]
MSDRSAVSSPSSRSQQASSPPDVQHGVIMNKLWPIKMVWGSPMTVLKFYFVDNVNCTKNRKKAVLTTISKSARDEAKEKYDSEQKTGGSPPNKRRRSQSNARAQSNPFDFVTWEDHANVRFQESPKKDGSDIRITFSGKGFDSAIGIDAKDDSCEEDSMVLAGLPDRYPPLPEHRRRILHEFGHALGLEHEHQGPAARRLLKLNEELVKKNPRDNTPSDGTKVDPEKEKERLRDHIKFIQENILDGVEDDEDLWNYTNFDPASIMTYQIPDEWQEQPDKITIEYVLKLSKYDQATITLMYPPDIRDKSQEDRFRKAMETLHLDSNTSSEMIRKFTEDPEGNPADRLTRLRDRFNQWKNGNKLLYKGELDVLRGIDPKSLRQSGINQFVGEVAKNKLFQSIVKNIVYRTMVQHGIPTNVSIPGATQTEITRLVAALSVHDEIGQLVRQHSVAFSGDKDDDVHKVCNPDPI